MYNSVNRFIVGSETKALVETGHQYLAENINYLSHQFIGGSVNNLLNI
jgi:hypothetical protein